MKKSLFVQSAAAGLLAGLASFAAPATAAELGSPAMEPLGEDEGCKGKGGCGGKDGCGGKHGCGGKDDKKDKKEKKESSQLF